MTPSMRTSYTVTLPEDSLAAAFPALARELRSRSPLSPSLLLSSFVGLLLNKAKVRGAPFRDPPPPMQRAWGSAYSPGRPPRRAPNARARILPSPHRSFPRVLARNAPTPGDFTLTRIPPPLREVSVPESPESSSCSPAPITPSTRLYLGS